MTHPHPSNTRNLDLRQLDATAVSLIAAHEKVRQIHQGQIPLPEVVELFISNHCTFACPHCRCAPYHGELLGITRNQSHYVAQKMLKAGEFKMAGKPSAGAYYVPAS